MRVFLYSIILFCVTIANAANPTVVSCNSIGGDNGANPSITRTNTAGNAMIAIVTSHVGQNRSGITISDTKSSNWMFITSKNPDDFNAGGLQLTFLALNIAGGSDTVSLPSPYTYGSLTVCEYTNVATVDAIAGAGSNAANSSTSVSLGPITSLSANTTFIVTSYTDSFSGATISTPAGFTQQQHYANMLATVYVFDKVISTGSQSVTVSSSVSGNIINGIILSSTPVTSPTIQNTYVHASSEVRTYQCTASGHSLLYIFGVHSSGSSDENAVGEFTDSLHNIWNYVGKTPNNFGNVRAYYAPLCIVGSGTLSPTVAGFEASSSLILEINSMGNTFTPVLYSSFASSNSSPLSTGAITVPASNMQIAFAADTNQPAYSGAYTAPAGYNVQDWVFGSYAFIQIFVNNTVSSGSTNLSISNSNASPNFHVGVIAFVPNQTGPTNGFIQNTYFCKYSPTFSTPVTATTSFNTTAGDMLSVVVGQNGSIQAAPTSIVDSCTDSYNLDLSGPSGDTYTYSTMLKCSGIVTITVTPSSAQNSMCILAQEYKGFTNILNATGSTARQNTSPIASSITTTVPNALLINTTSVINLNRGMIFSTNAAYTLRNINDAARESQQAIVDRIVTSATTYTNSSVVLNQVGAAPSNASVAFVAYAPVLTRPQLWITEKLPFNWRK